MPRPELPSFHESGRILRHSRPQQMLLLGTTLAYKSPAGSAKPLDFHFFVVEEIDCSPSADVTPTCFAITVYSHVGESHFKALPLACAAHSKCYGKVCRMSYKDDRIRPQMPCEQALE
jgi:hypothetical protein